MSQKSGKFTYLGLAAELAAWYNSNKTAKKRHSSLLAEKIIKKQGGIGNAGNRLL